MSLWFQTLQKRPEMKQSKFSDRFILETSMKQKKIFYRAEFYEITKKVGVDETEMSIHKEKNNRHMRFAETLRENSKMSDLIVM